MATIQTHNDLKDLNTRASSIEVMNARLADAIDLALITKQAHWNVKGPQFIAIHEMLDTFRTELDENVSQAPPTASRVVARGNHPQAIANQKSTDQGYLALIRGLCGGCQGRA